MERPTKRARVSPDSAREDAQSNTYLASMHRSITPPPRTRSGQSMPSISTHHQQDGQTEELPTRDLPTPHHPHQIPSPVQLTHIRDFPSQKGYNADTIRLRDILGDPMIRECWQFNYLFDVDFLMSQFDEDVRDLVQVKVVHGSWEKEAPNRIRIEEACTRFKNVESIVAYMPERFGTHHSKMMVLLRHDDLAQIIIHTANMISGDWANMSQAVWRSPLLPLQKQGAAAESTARSTIGSGVRFKRDLLAYLKAYGTKKTGPLVQQLNGYDFAGIRAALVASIPCRQHVDSGLDSDRLTLWGWPALKDLMGRIPIRRRTDPSTAPKPHIVIQVRVPEATVSTFTKTYLQISSVASLGQTDKWLKDTFFASLAPPSPSSTPRPKFSIIFPTPDEIRRSLDGYQSGGSIHMKTQSAPQQKQLQYMRPYLCQWAGDSVSDSGCVDLTQEEEKRSKRAAGRARAAPHIKTYIRFSDAETMDDIDWAMVTSANLSTQAWGAGTNPKGEIRISSWEIGVVVWPQLFDDSATVAMAPCFQTDIPSVASKSESPSVVVGFRMPYDLPLTPYKAADEPWCATATHHLPDWQGRSWVL
ncbi:hypothetical protein N7510_009812 [Penicillium lagena]|uniref:uncharacterized protein n=1 Tax=Penicillium lagena TaxID=94218 RepID=UPI002540FB56|nr:uncharacterized protein N7510_009812 [Penicillium lagena]KAJ5604658.1 hypothetical protein N7510_009812 [Penicillium lagena]